MNRLPRLSCKPLRSAGILLLGLQLVTGSATSQTSPAERVFNLPQAELQKALRDLRASSPGRLPILEGFVSPDVAALDAYQRAYYQYTITMRPTASGATSLKVVAKITAWFADGQRSGYRALPSSGRLETDLIERLEDELQHKAASVANQAPLTEPRSAQSAAAVDSTTTPPKARPDTATANLFRTPLPTPKSAARVDFTPPSAPELAEQKHVRELNEQAANLEEILRNQSRPDDLAAVLKTGTPVFDKPVETSQVLFLADAEDEFKVVQQSGPWVHVQVSGLSRGWLRRSDLELISSGAYPNSNVASPATNASPQTHEETSLFPGDWTPLRGRIVRIVWVRPEVAPAPQVATDHWLLARSLFRDTYTRVINSAPRVEGIVIVVDAADGGMIAATMNTLQRWNTGVLTDAAFQKECWADPPETLHESTVRAHGTELQAQ